MDDGLVIGRLASPVVGADFRYGFTFLAYGLLTGGDEGFEIGFAAGVPFATANDAPGAGF